MKARPPFERTYIFILMALLGFMIADLGILSIRDKMLPQKAPPPARPHFNQFASMPDRNIFAPITGRNIFNADGKIPDAFGSAGGQQQDAPPVASQLPLALIGTIVHVDGARSVATITLSSKHEDRPFVVGDDIDGLAKVTKVGRGRVEFRNTSTQRLEFIELKKDSKLSMSVAAVKTNGEVQQTSDTDFSIKRSDVNKLTSNLGDLLQQARAVPNIVDGVIQCFKMVDIQKGSIFEKLGLRAGDCIGSVNGEKIDSPAKAMELYNALRGNSATINLGIDRGGHKEDLNYTIQ